MCILNKSLVNSLCGTLETHVCQWTCSSAHFPFSCSPSDSLRMGFKYQVIVFKFPMCYNRGYLEQWLFSEDKLE